METNDHKKTCWGWWTFLCRAEIIPLMQFMYCHCFVSLASAGLYIPVGLLAGVHFPIEWDAAVKTKAAIICGVVPAVAAVIGIIFGIILYKGVVHNQIPYLKLWFRYYVICWIGNCLNFAYIASITLSALVFLFIFLIFMSVTITRFTLEIERRSEIEEIKEDEKRNSHILKPIASELSESTYLLISANG